MIELTVRLVASLAIVVGLLLLTVRLGGRRFRPKAGTPMRVVHRQALTRSSSLLVVEVGRRSLVLGATEHQINVLAELDESEVVASLLHEEIIDMEAVRRAGLAPESHPVPAPARTPAPRSGGARKAVDRAPGARKAIGGGASGGRRVLEGTPGGRRALESTPGTRRASKPQPRRRAGSRALRPEPAALNPASGALAGSILSPQTWRVALAATKGRA